MATLATTYTNARAHVPGSNTTNMPDSTLLVPANRLYLLLYEMWPLAVRTSPTAMGWSMSAPAAGTKVKTSTYAKYTRITAVRYEGAAGASAQGVGPVLQYLTLPQYELESSTFTWTNGVTRFYTLQRNSDGTWTLLFGPGTDGVIDYNFSAEGEIEPTALTSGSSTLLLPAGRIAELDLMLGWWIANQLGRPVEAYLREQIGPNEAFNKFVGNEQARGEFVDGASRGRP